MGRYLGPVCRLCRREGVSVCGRGVKCALVKRKKAPGVLPSRSNRKPSDYAIELREKQKLKRMYGSLREKQFANIFKQAERRKGKTGDLLLETLESRFDNVIVKSNFAVSYSQARQLITHRHFLINGKNVNVPSYLIKKGDCIKLKDNSKVVVVIRSNLKDLTKRKEPEWLEVDQNKIECNILSLPRKGDIVSSIDEQLIVEFYSK